MPKRKRRRKPLKRAHAGTDAGPVGALRPPAGSGVGPAASLADQANEEPEPDHQVPQQAAVLPGTSGRIGGSSDWSTGPGSAVVVI